jgi:hypothetical protein
MSNRVCGLAAAAAALCLALAPRPANAGPLDHCPVFPLPHSVVLCFDEEPSGSAASAATFENVTVLDALILSEAHASFLLGMDTEGFATSGLQGLLNALVPSVEFFFDVPITHFEASVVALPSPTGVPVPVVIQGFRAGELRAFVLSDVGGVRPDGTHANHIGFHDDFVGFDYVRIFAALGPCDGEDCLVGPTTSFFADTVKFVVPEPGAASLAAATLCGLGIWLTCGRRPRRTPGRSPERTSGRSPKRGPA